ncbi:hypothetical protein O181_069981 [Austropuccinia psidii MF-1]|uniref:Uncharacterized protein n=1 Tax=Austropuccinia psidii MF-1 TaxID=1389203 RepID=A0A9Q3EXU2_9BASI|nr:hypothetical protein [Austropuccinia psidii MF-1]
MSILKLFCEPFGYFVISQRLTDLFTGYRQRDFARWTNVVGPIPTSGRPIYSSSEVLIYRINNQDSEASDKLDGEEVEALNPLIGHSSSSSPTQPPAKNSPIQLIPSTPRKFQPILPTVLSSVPHPSPRSSTSRPSLDSPMKPSPITSHHLQKIATFGQDQKKKRGLVSFAIPSHSSVLK